MGFLFSGLPLFFSGTCTHSLHKGHITLQELQAFGLMLHIMAFCLSGKIAVSHVDISTAKAYLFN